MGLSLAWMRPEAPYMPIASAGMLAALADVGQPATIRWEPSPLGMRMILESELSWLDLAEAVARAPWPDLAAVQWSTKLGQAIKPMLKLAADPVAELTRLRHAADAGGLVAEVRLLRACVTDAVLDADGVPSRSRLLRGVKADLSGVADNVKADPSSLAAELENGPRWIAGGSGRGLGLIPEIQTFGGTTGRNPSTSAVGSHSPLLFRLLWLGVMALPPVAILSGRNRTVGGPLVAGPATLGWPVWSCELDLRSLRGLFSASEIHQHGGLDREWSRQRDVAAVYRSQAVAINTTVSVFRWGQRIA